MVYVLQKQRRISIDNDGIKTEAALHGGRFCVRLSPSWKTCVLTPVHNLHNRTL